MHAGLRILLSPGSIRPTLLVHAVDPGVLFQEREWGIFYWIRVLCLVVLPK